MFAVSPEAAGALLADILSEPARVAWDDAAEVMDIDEDALRAGRLAPRLYGHARVPVARNRMQAAKGGPRRRFRRGAGGGGGGGRGGDGAGHALCDRTGDQRGRGDAGGGA